MNLLYWYKYEVLQSVTWAIEVFPHRCVTVIVDSSPVLSTSLPAGPGVPDHAHILWSILAPSSSVVAGDGVYNSVVLAGDTLLDPPGLSSGSSGFSVPSFK